MRTVSLASLKLLLSLVAILASAPAHAQACGTTLYASVTLTADVVCGPGQDGLIVGDHKVRIELNGFAILGPFSISTPSGFARGISSRGFERIQIVGPGLITGFSAPIEIEGGNSHLISEVDAIQEWGDPVSVRNASGAVIQRSRMTRLEIASDPGRRATANQVIDNVIGANPGSGGAGIWLRGCNTADNMVAYNSINADYGHAVSLYEGANANQVIKNKMELGQVYLAGASNNLIAGNSFQQDSVTFASVEIESSGYPIRCARGAVLSSSRNIVRDNQMHSGEYGVWIDDISGIAPSGANLVTGNAFSGQTYSGLFFGPGAAGNDARGNTYINVPVIAYDLGSGNLWP